MPLQDAGLQQAHRLPACLLERSQIHSVSDPLAGHQCLLKGGMAPCAPPPVPPDGAVSQVVESR
jgi:hypothetical protein